MENLLKYEEFKEKIRERLEKRFDDDVSVKIDKVIKNNSQEYDSLVIIRTGYGCSPNFYLKFYYEKYEKGETIESILNSIIRDYNESNNNLGKFNFDMSYENCCDKITFRLVSKEKNEKLLKTIPYIPFLDMVIVFYCVVVVEEKGVASIRINNSLVEKWGISTKELFCLAQINTVKLFPKKTYKLETMLRKILCNVDDSDSENEGRYFDGVGPYVITNTKGINGAGVILYKGVLKEISEMLGGDFYILPSSIHEVIVLKDMGEDSDEDMENMVREANESCVLPEEVLSDHAYRYLEELDRIEICVTSKMGA